VPIIMLTGHSEKRRVIEARDTGVTEFLAKPISAKALYQRVLNVVANPRPFIKTKTYFGPCRRRNLYGTYVGPDAIISGVFKRIGEDWALLSPGLIFKLYPCCGSTHASIDAILSLRNQFNIDWKRTREIEIGVHPRRLPHVNRPRPKTGLEGKFSLQYTGAVALVDGEVRPDHFLKEAFDDQRVQSLLERVVVKELPPAEQTIVEGRDDCYAATVRIFTDETEYLLHIDAPSGSIPEFPVSDSELERKFRSAVSPVIGRDNVDQLWGQMDDWLIGKTGTQAFLNHVNRLVLKGD